VARQTRSQRRARRQAQEASSAGAPPRGRPPVANGGQEPPDRSRSDRSPAPAPREQERRGGPINFIRESWAELKKVEWPGQAQLVQGVVVVLIACVIVGAYLFAADQVFKRFVENVLLGQ
jgi:preprotein translocase subunit SecE